MPKRIENLVKQLRQQGFRITTQRRLVLEVLLAEEYAHLSSDEVAAALTARGLTLNNATVYRILQWLKDVGLVSQTDIGIGHDVYSWVGQTPHHHLVCLNCKHVINVDDDLFEPLRAQLLAEHGFHARIEHFAIFGLCDACAGQAPAADSP